MGLKCVDCGTELETEKKSTNIKVTLSNPGVVMFEEEAIICPKCNEKYCDEDDYERLASAFDKAYAEKHKKH